MKPSLPMKINVTFLGTGTSVGCPMIGCPCDVCTSEDPRDRRLRNAALLQVDDKNILIDCGPDFRQQMLREKVNKLDAILITHIHNDHTAGFDDIRPFNFMTRRDMPVYTDEFTARDLKRRFEYVFGPSKYPGAPRADIIYIDKDTPFKAAGIPVTPLEVLHGKLPVLGFRFGHFAYVTDAKSIDQTELTKLEGVEYLAINALQQKTHHAHLTLHEALEVIEKINPKKAFLTHISHKMGKHAQVSPTLPDNVEFAYDGLKIDCGESV
jgi:phosphoribosyl 1,2-cyclic phosphate phosphodiesterase